jgi:hypothetical protein
MNNLKINAGTATQKKAFINAPDAAEFIVINA